MATDIQRSFAGGEISPRLHHRADLAKWQSSLVTARNYIVPVQGGVENRAGLRFRAEVKDSTKRFRLVEFNFGLDQTYLLEFGDFYMRVHKLGAQVVDSTKAISGITQALPAVVTANAHGFSNGDEVQINGVLGMTELNGRNFKIVGVTANTFQLQYMDGTNVDSSGFGEWTSGGTASRVFTLATPYAEADLPELRFSQSADVVVITWKVYDIRELVRTGDASWALNTITMEPKIAPPHGATVSGSGGGSNTIRYQVVSVSKTGERSLPGRSATKAITGVTNTLGAVIVVTAVSHGWQNGEEVYIEGVGGVTQINGRTFVIANVAANTFELSGELGTGVGSYSGGGTAATPYLVIYNEGLGNSRTITIPIVPDAIEYNIYDDNGTVAGVFGFVGVARKRGSTVQFIDSNLQGDTSDTPPDANNPFAGAANFPAAVTHYQQRRVFANSQNDPEGFWASVVGSFKNFTARRPPQDDDAITSSLAGRQVNEILHLFELPASLVALTSGGPWAIRGDEAGILMPRAINARQHGSVGACRLRPLRIGNVGLYVGADERTVRDLAFELESEGYRGVDLTILADHLFESFTLVDWTFQERPNSIVWAARSDGKLLGMTYLPEQEVLAWHHHDVDGEVENACVVQEGDEHTLYLGVKRAVDGRTVRYIEQMETRVIDDIRDLLMVDCALTYDGRNHDSTRTMSIFSSGSFEWLEELSVEDSAGPFSASDIGKEIHITGEDENGNTVVIRILIEGIDGSGKATGVANRDVPTPMQGTPLSDWAIAVKNVSGLWHIEGKDVSVLGDGHVVASPNNPAYLSLSVENGGITLERAYGVIHVGLPVTYDLKTLRLENVQGETLVNKASNINRVTMGVERSKGAWVGQHAPEEDVDFDPTAPDLLLGLTEVKVRTDEGYDEPVKLATGTLDVRFRPGWKAKGSVFLRQVDPVPVSIVTIAPAGVIPARA